MRVQRRTQATVHLDRLERNIRNIQSRLHNGAEMMAVLKADGYGHGIAGIYPTFAACGVKRFAVAVWEEGAALRAAGAADEPILILGDTWDEQLPHLIEHRLTPAIFCEETAQKLSDLAVKAGVVQPIHIKLDTGMHRVGFPCTEQAAEAICRIARMPGLCITGLFTHFARADEMDRSETADQFRRYETMLSRLQAAGVEIPLLHVANSASILLRPDVHLHAARAGDILYGLSPVDEDTWADAGFEEVMTWETYVALVKTVPQGAQIGYGGTRVTDRETVVATLPVGFADGYSRRLSNRGYVMIHGQKAPILGRVCMDQFMVDVTDIPNVSRGDAVTLLGEGMTIAQMADMLEINVDEIVCGISKRVPRVYHP